MKTARLSVAPVAAKRLGTHLGPMDALDQSCRQAIDRAHAAYDDAARQGTTSALLAARACVSSAWRVLGAARVLSLDPHADPGAACHAAEVVRAEGPKLRTVQLALVRLESSIADR
jgi:hypothetical protein